MKLPGTVVCDTSSNTTVEMSKFPSVFKKRNDGKALATTTPSASGTIGWTPEDLQKRRLQAFVKGINVSGIGISAALTNVTNEFKINVDTFDYDNLTFDLHRLSSEGLVAVGLNHEMTEAGNHVKIAYGVEKPGQYVMDIKYLGLPVPMSPFKIEVHDGDSINIKEIIAYGKGLKRCLAGDVTTFQVETKKVGYGRITVAVDGEVDVPLCISECKYGYKVQYIATSVGNFFLRVKINGKHIRGSPFMVKSEKKREIPESAKKLFKRGIILGGKENKTDLQP